mgnify:CR=1 FL=1
MSKVGMSEPWLDIVGIGEDGMDGLTADAARRVLEAEVIIGGDRHHTLAGNENAERVAWPSPFDAMIDKIKSFKGRRLVILVTGDPLWYSVGARIVRSIASEEIRFHPQLSAFQWAAARLGWSLADCETVTIHGRADSQILPHLAPNVRLLVLTQNGGSPKAVADLLVQRGFGESDMVALAALGGPDEAQFSGRAADWSHHVPDFHTLAVNCVAGPDAVWYPRTGGLPDEAFEHDGQMTKQDVRAVTIAKLAPYSDAVLWDIGAGCGSVSIEWMRAARYARAIGIEPRADRRDMAAQNALALGAPKLELIDGTVPQALENLDAPDAVFIGGGLSAATFEAVWAAVRPLGRVVANAVTLESEATLIELHKTYGGDLVKIQTHRAEPIGPLTGWRPAMPVTQWSLIKR